MHTSFRASTVKALNTWIIISNWPSLFDICPMSPTPTCVTISQIGWPFIFWFVHLPLRYVYHTKVPTLLVKSTFNGLMSIRMLNAINSFKIWLPLLSNPTKMCLKFHICRKSKNYCRKSLFLNKRLNLFIWLFSCSLIFYFIIESMKRLFVE